MVWLLTLSALTRITRAENPTFRDGTDTTREEFEGMIKLAARHCDCEVIHFYIVKEQHSNGKSHIHAAIRFSKALYDYILARFCKVTCRCFVEVKAFTDYGAAARYLSQPSVDKPTVDEHPRMSDNHPGGHYNRQSNADRRRSTMGGQNPEAGGGRVPVVKEEPAPDVKDEVISLAAVLFFSAERCGNTNIVPNSTRYQI
jgi:hypothetical protein